MSDRKLYKVGDLVVLKSGGPVMTIARGLSGMNTYTCSWFSGKKHESGSFAPDALRPASDDELKPAR